MPASKKKEPDNKPPAYKLCLKGHKNSLNAQNCWVCGQDLDKKEPEKPKFVQTANTAVPANFVDVNIVVPGECEKYVGKRERCDEKDPSGHICTFKPNCIIRLKRYKK